MPTTTSDSFPGSGSRDRVEVHLPLAGEQEQRPLLDQGSREDDPLPGADRADAIGRHGAQPLEHDPVAGSGHAPQVLRRGGRDLVGEELLRVVPFEEAAVEEQPVRDRAGRLERGRVGPGQRGRGRETTAGSGDSATTPGADGRRGLGGQGLGTEAARPPPAAASPGHLPARGSRRSTGASSRGSSSPLSTRVH